MATVLAMVVLSGCGVVLGSQGAGPRAEKKLLEMDPDAERAPSVVGGGGLAANGAPLPALVTTTVPGQRAEDTTPERTEGTMPSFPDTVAGRIAARRAPDDFWAMTRFLATNEPIVKPTNKPVCVDLRVAQEAGYAFDIVTKARPDVETLRSAFLDVEKSLQQLVKYVPAELPQSVVASAAGAREVSSKAAGITSATALGELIDSYARQSGASVSALFAGQAENCPNLTP